MRPQTIDRLAGVLAMSLALAASLPPNANAQCVLPPAGQVAWWRAEGNAADQAGTNGGTLFNGAGFTTGETGQAFVFNGSTSYIEVPDSPSLQLTNQLTVEFWVKRQWLDSRDYVIEKGGDWTGNAANYAVALHGSSYNYCLVFVFAGGWRGGGSIPDFNWHHCAVVARQGDANPTFYVDGVQQPTRYAQGVSTINLYPSTRELHIGALLDPVTGWYYYSKAIVDELALYSRTLSPDEVLGIFNAGSAGKCTAPMRPAITAQPTNQTVVAGATALINASAGGTAPIGCQWFFNEVPLTEGGRISGSASPALTLSGVQAADAGSYRLVVSNSFGMATSSVATLDVLLPPSIGSQPQDQALMPGSNAFFSVQASGVGPLGYQWFLNGIVLTNDSRHAGADSTSLTISNLQVADGGSYTVAVSNLAGSVTSAPALLTVLEPPLFFSQPVGCSVPLGLPAAFSASVSGTAPLGFQWQLNGVDIPNATNATFTLAAVAAADLGTYRLAVTNAAGFALSDPAPLTLGNVAAWGRNDSLQALVPAGLSNVTALAAGAYHSLALRANGTVAAWGYNGYGQLNVPADLGGVIAIAGGGLHSLALRADGMVAGWGNNSYGQTNIPAGLSNVVAIAAGYYYSLALRSDGSVAAWGLDNYGITNFASSLSKIVAISSGISHCLALRADGTVIAWGMNTYGQTTVPGYLNNVVAIAAGGYHSLALRADGSIASWGFNTSGQTNVPVGLTNATALAAGHYHSLALRADGTVIAWGGNDYGPTNTPASLTNVVTIAAGASHNLVLLSDGHPLLTRQPASVTSWSGRPLALRAQAVGAPPLSFQWRKNGVVIPDATNATLYLPSAAAADQGAYQLTVTNSLGATATLPVTVTILDGVAPVFLSQLPSAQTNYLGSRATLGCSIGGSGPLFFQWRLNGQPIPGAIGDELLFDPVQLTNAGSYSLVVTNQFGPLYSMPLNLKVTQLKAWGYLPAEPPGSASNVIAVSQGYYSCLALRTDGKVVGWYMGRGPGFPPVPATLSNVVAVSTGSDHYTALRSDGSVFVWGSNTYGQSNVPPAALSGVTAIAAGYSHDLALRSDGTVVSWGYNPYNLTNVPAGLSGVVAVGAGAAHSLALKSDGTVVGWGTSSAYSPIPPWATNLIAIAVGGSHNLGLRADGAVVAWGQNGSGQATVPAGLSNVVAVAAGANHSAALRSDGTLVTWGSSSAAVPLGDITSAIQLSAGGDNGLTLFGSRSPAATVQPFNRTLFRGTNTTLVAKAVGAPPLAYQWRFKGADLPGATTDSLALADLQLAQSGAYQLVVSNAYGTATLKTKLMVTIPLGEALDAAGLTWTSTGSAQWYGQADTSFDGLGAVRSGAIGNSQETILQTTVIGPGQLTWRWKVSCELYFDKLEFRFNGVSQFAVSGELDWEQRSFAIPAGAQTLQWRYSKDASFSDGEDAAWVDAVAFVPNPPVITRQPVDQTVNMGDSVLIPVTASGSPPLSYQWFQDGAAVPGGTGSTLSLSSATRRNGGVYSVLVSNPGGGTPSGNAVLKVLVPQRLGTPSVLADGSLALSSRDADGGLLIPADLASFEAQASTNLADWQSLPAALSLVNGRLQLQDSDRTNYPCRFYRILEH